MPTPFFRVSRPGLVLGLVSAVFMLHALSVHPQSRSESSPDAGQGAASSGTSSGASAPSGATGSGTGKIGRADEKLMSQLAEANLSEISASKMALEKSQNDQVKSFAQKMVDDHTRSLDELKQLAQAKGVTLPTEPSREQKAMEKRLSSLSGEKFDKQYLEQAGERSHKSTHKLLKQASTKAQDTDLKNYASKAMGVVESHQQLTEETERGMKSTSRGKSEGGSTGSGTPKEQ